MCVYSGRSHRLSKVKELWWELGSAVPEDIKQNMSVQEREFFVGYDKIMAQYGNAYPELDLTSVCFLYCGVAVVSEGQ
jgi:hypothetical protein